jgi:hypothetical protein
MKLQMINWIHNQASFLVSKDMVEISAHTWFQHNCVLIEPLFLLFVFFPVGLNIGTGNRAYLSAGVSFIPIITSPCIGNISLS